MGRGSSFNGFTCVAFREKLSSFKPYFRELRAVDDPNYRLWRDADESARIYLHGRPPRLFFERVLCYSRG